MKKWWSKSEAGEIGTTPWLHPDVNAYLETLLFPDMAVLEHGSGGSTAWLARQVKRVVSIETNSAWYDSLVVLLPDNARLILWDRGKYPALRDKFDLILIDGEPVADRARFIKDVTKFVRPGGFVVLDNANRPEYAVERERLAGQADLLKRFDCNEPGTLYLVTEFYQLKGKDDESRD